VLQKYARETIHCWKPAMALINLSAWAPMWKDVEMRRFITVGFLGFVLLIPLAITSPAGWIRRLGGKRWQLLHRSIYVAALVV